MILILDPEETALIDDLITEILVEHDSSEGSITVAQLQKRALERIRLDERFILLQKYLPESE